MTVIPIVTGALGINAKRLVWSLKLEDKWKHPDNSINKIDQNTEKNLGDLRRIAVSQTLV